LFYGPLHYITVYFIRTDNYRERRKAGNMI